VVKALKLSVNARVVPGCWTGLSGTYLISDGAIVGCTKLAKSQRVNIFFSSRFGCDAGRVSYGPGRARDELADGQQYLFFLKGEKIFGVLELEVATHRE